MIGAGKGWNIEEGLIKLEKAHPVRASIQVIGPWCQHLKVLLLKPGQKPLEAKSLFCPDLPNLTLGLKNGGMRRGC